MYRLRHFEQQVNTTLLTFVLVGVHFSFNIISAAGFKLSAQSQNVRGFLVWQLVGNLAGFITVLALTALLRYIPLSIAYPVTTGLAVIGVQVVAAGYLFHEPISSRQWLGVLFIVGGILLVGGREAGGA